jgi:hypothetical protein
VTEGAFLDVCTLTLLDQLLEWNWNTATTATTTPTTTSPKELWKTMTNILSKRSGLAGWILPQLEPMDLVVSGMNDDDNDDKEEDDIYYVSRVVRLVQRVYQVSVQEKQQAASSQPSHKRRKLLLTSSSTSSKSTKEWRLPVAYLWALTIYQVTTTANTNTNTVVGCDDSNSNNNRSWSNLESMFLKLCKSCYKPMTHLDTHAALALLGWQLLADPQSTTTMQGLTASTVVSLLSRTEYVE